MAKERGVAHARARTDVTNRDSLQRRAFQQLQQRLPQGLTRADCPRVTGGPKARIMYFPAHPVYALTAAKVMNYDGSYLTQCGAAIPLNSAAGVYWDPYP